MKPQQPTLTSERLQLRPFAASDADHVQHLAGHRAVADTTLSIPHPYPPGAAAEWIVQHAPGYAAGTQATFAVITRKDATLVGAVGLTFPSAARGELGYWIGHPHWGHGHATEAARAVIAFGFRNLALHRIQAHHLTRNPASGRVLLKLGMHPEGIQRHILWKDGQPEEAAFFSILAAEWLRSTLGGE